MSSSGKSGIPPFRFISAKASATSTASAILPPDHLWIGKNRGNSRVISTMQIDDHRLREDAAGCWH
jgi:hypothetical protein